MGRSVSYLSNAIRVSYFEWPEILDEDDQPTGEYEEGDIVISDIQQCIMSVFPLFTEVDKWADREDHIILEGYGTQIAVSEYCGLASLSIRVDPYFNDHHDTEEEFQSFKETTEQWISDHWEEISKPWDRLQSMGRASNGEQFFQKIN